MTRGDVQGHCAGVVLAGGQSRRMGRDKAVLDWNGAPLAQHVAGVLNAAGCDSVVQVGGDAATGVAVVPDRYPGQGPLGALLTAADVLDRTWLAVVACDVPLLRPVTMARLIDRAVLHPEFDVVVATTRCVQPACAVWRRSTVETEVRRMWDAGERSLQGALGRLAADHLAVPARDLHNVNTPSDLAQAGNVGGMVDEITVHELSELLPTGITLIDVREPDEYASGHAPGAVLVPLGSILAGEATPQPSGSGPVYMICRSGARSMRACEKLDAQGMAAVNVMGGTMAWMASGFEVVEGMDPS